MIVYSRRVIQLAIAIMALVVLQGQAAAKPRAGHRHRAAPKQRTYAWRASTFTQKLHAPADQATGAVAATRPDARPPLVLMRAGSTEHVTLTPARDDGGFSSEDLSEASRAFAWRHNGATRDIHPRLLDLVYQTQQHFGVSHVVLVSGYRGARPSSRHYQGRAIDMILPGVNDAEAAAWLRSLGFVGVGLYPRSGFVHLDVRSQSYFWVDRARPGRRGKVRPMLMGEAQTADKKALARGVMPTPELGNDMFGGKFLYAEGEQDLFAPEEAETDHPDMAFLDEALESFDRAHEEQFLELRAEEDAENEWEP